MNCPQNYFCPVQTISYLSFPCPAGTYGQSAGLYSASQCSTCPAGKYCVSRFIFLNLWKSYSHTEWSNFHILSLFFILFFNRYFFILLLNPFLLLFIHIFLSSLLRILPSTGDWLFTGSLSSRNVLSVRRRHLAVVVHTVRAGICLSKLRQV